jgi:hypothetical protein
MHRAIVRYHIDDSTPTLYFYMKILIMDMESGVL